MFAHMVLTAELGCVYYAGTIVGVSVAILLVLFGIQQFGTNTIGYAFAPVMVVFFLFNSGIGAYNIFKYSPSIFKVTK